MYNGQFDDELNYIVNEKFRELTKNLLNELPDYFWEVPASSTGKYHPTYSLGKGGLVRHTKAAVKIANSILNDADVYGWTQDDNDVAIAALLLHDGFKHGLNHSKYTVHEHPLIAADFVRSKLDTVIDSDLESRYYYDSVAKAIATHMGRWNVSSRSDVVLPLPETTGQDIVHLCDYLASRKFINVDFDDFNI